MGVKTISFERFTCERCDEEEDIIHGEIDNRDKWGHATAQSYQGGQIFERDYKITLCPKCCQSLREWHSSREEA